MSAKSGKSFKRILLLGKNGQVGWELQRTLDPLGEVTALGYPAIDLAQPALIRNIVREIKPGLIVNAAAYTAVDKAEEEHDLALKVNGIAPGVLAEEAKRIGAGLIHFSTDYVYDGSKNTPYTEEDLPNPLNVYGKTKLAGDLAISETEVPHLIIRTSWVYGLRGNNFLLTILKMLREKEEIAIINDQIGTPTSSRMIAEVTAQVIGRNVKDEHHFIGSKSGIYNLTGLGSASWYCFAKEIKKLDKRKSEHRCKQVKPIISSELVRCARRPAYSELDKTKLIEAFYIPLPHWRTELQRVMQ